MSNLVYNTYRVARGLGVCADDLTAVTIKALAVDVDAYTVDTDADEFLDDIPGAAIIATSPALGTPTVGSIPGMFDAEDIEFAGFTGASIEALVLYIDDGAPETSRLLCYISSATGLPFTPDGAPKDVQWPVGGIFAP